MTAVLIAMVLTFVLLGPEAACLILVLGYLMFGLK